MTDVQLRQDVLDELEFEPSIDAIRVSVSNDTVTLDGKVDNWDELEAVENAAWSAPGVRFVEDRLTIG